MKFLNLLKKELREILTPQIIIGVIATTAILLMVGEFMGSAVSDAVKNMGNVNIIDEDDTEFSRNVLESLETIGYTLKKFDAPLARLNETDLLRETETDSIYIIPAGFTQSIFDDKKPASVRHIESVRNTALSSQLEAMTGLGGVVGELVKAQLLAENFGLTAEDIALIGAPVLMDETAVVQDKTANVSASAISGALMSQGMVFPIVIFILIMFVSQMIIAAISNEKIDKTLETLLSAPVSRIAVLTSKMLAATLVALLNAVAYMYGFSRFMGSVMDSEMAADAAGEMANTTDVMAQLGLELNTMGYVLMGLQLFVTIMIVLSISLILGAMVSDIKSAQTVVMPVMFAAMIPYLISMILDINTVSLPVRMLVYAIPFTHTFNAVENIMFGNWTAYALGLAYQVIFFIVCMYFALKLFTSDKIFTISLNFGQKKKFAKQTQSS